MKKTVEAALIVLFNIALLFSAIAIPALTLATSESFYEWGLRKTGIYSAIDEDGKIHKFKVDYIGGDEDTTAVFEDCQIDIISSHIVDFMSGNAKSFDLVLDGVYIIGEGERDGIHVFGEEAISHMQDVRELVEAVKLLSLLSLIILIAGVVSYVLFIKRLSVSPHKISRIFYSALLALCILFLLFSFATKGERSFFLALWQNLHYIIFPFQTGKVEGSVLCDTLAVILSTEFFIRAVVIILSIVIFTVALWLTLSFLYEKRIKRKDLYF